MHAVVDKLIETIVFPIKIGNCAVFIDDEFAVFVHRIIFAFDVGGFKIETFYRYYFFDGIGKAFGAYFVERVFKHAHRFAVNYVSFPYRHKPCFIFVNAEIFLFHCNNFPDF